MGFLGWLLFGVVMLIASSGLMVILATRLPDGTLKELARLLPACHPATLDRLLGDAQPTVGLSAHT